MTTAAKRLPREFRPPDVRDAGAGCQVVALADVEQAVVVQPAAPARRPHHQAALLGA